MRLAVIADIHGNVLALDAVLADIAAAGIDRIVNLGDVVSGPLWPRETAGRLMPLDLPTVRGNHDRWVVATPRAEQYPSDAFAHDELTEAQRQWLGGLPMVLDLEVEGLAIRCFHATPSDDNTYLMHRVGEGGMVPAAAAEVRAGLGATGSAGLVLCGHTHQARVLALPGGPLVVNPGSIGLPAYSDPTPPRPHVSEAGSPHARYAIVTIAAGQVASVELRAIAYDWRAAAARADGLGSADWAHALATGFMA
ncbi:MAG: metallophosphoesterase family protein [Phreatobacter sp.]|uniref:metallophosphoesterase family protein n=1 Tax=Phreatobacter sp. TaxID=1966341 RepID=UPI001A394A2B|nr:metallophosphoesterase family protein [Phreatobacter sp.]MBL8568799.1 metallophosphoesterase family protein [Phreatobacter sp.]